jgi:hypothetical protein
MGVQEDGWENMLAEWNNELREENMKLRQELDEMFMHQVFSKYIFTMEEKK